MAEEVVTPIVETAIEPVVEPTSLIDVVAVEPVVEPVVEEVAEEVIEEVVEEVTEEETDTSVNVEEAIEKFGDLMEDGKLNEVLADFNEGKITGKALISKLLNEVGIAKDEMEAKIDGEVEAVRQSLKDKPIEGIDPKELGQWVSKQGQEMVDIANTITDFSLGEDVVRSAIALLNKVRMGNDGVGDPDIKIVKEIGVSKDLLREEYMNIYKTKDGEERNIGIKNLVKKAESTGDPDLINWAKGMFN